MLVLLNFTHPLAGLFGGPQLAAMGKKSIWNADKSPYSMLVVMYKTVQTEIQIYVVDKLQCMVEKISCRTCINIGFDASLTTEHL